MSVGKLQVNLIHLDDKDVNGGDGDVGDDDDDVGDDDDNYVYGTLCKGVRHHDKVDFQNDNNDDHVPNILGIILMTIYSRTMI